MAEKPRVLIVSSNQFGEFAMALDFVAGLGDEFEHLLLLPESLANWNRSFFGARVKTYRSDADIRAQIARYEPQRLVFFSAYLLVTDRVIGHQWLQQLLAEQARRQVPVLTSDPFLGIAGALGLRDLRAPGRIFDDAFARRFPLFFKILFRRMLRSTDRVLARVPKIGSAVSEELDGSFRGFNSGNGLALSGAGDEAPPPAAEPYWLFILSGLDLTLLESRHGRAGAERLLEETLQCALVQRKQVVAVFPEALVDALRPRLGDRIRLATNASIERYHALLFAAERVFYWNMLSHSASFRLFNGLPAHFLGSGHVDAFIPRLHALAMEHYYGGTAPPILDPETQGLGEGELESSWAALQATLENKLMAVSRYPSSAVLMNEIASPGGPPVP